MEGLAHRSLLTLRPLSGPSSWLVQETEFQPPPRRGWPLLFLHCPRPPSWPARPTAAPLGLSVLLPSPRPRGACSFQKADKQRLTWRSNSSPGTTPSEEEQASTLTHFPRSSNYSAVVSAIYHTESRPLLTHSLSSIGFQRFSFGNQCCLKFQAKFKEAVYWII